MRRKNLIATRKANKNKLFFKDPKILNFYNKFKSIVFKTVNRKNFALAVSGGADSLCLAYFSKIYSITRLVFSKNMLCKCIRNQSGNSQKKMNICCFLYFTIGTRERELPKVHTKMYFPLFGFSHLFKIQWHKDTITGNPYRKH